MKKYRYFLFFLMTLISGHIYADKVAVGGNYTLFVKTDGSLWGCGANSSGELGDNTTISRDTPVKIMDGVSHVSAYSDHSLILKEDGTAWGCGVLESDGVTAYYYTNPIKIMDDVVSIQTGFCASFFIKKDGSLWSCGTYNHNGHLGNGTLERISIYTPAKIMDDVRSVSSANSHTLIVKKDNTLWACGDNYGKFGDGTTDDSSVPLKIMDDVVQASAGIRHSLVLKKDGTLWATGDGMPFGYGNNYRTNTFIQIMSDVDYFYAGYHNSFVVKKDGTLWVCGSNSNGVLGDGSTANVGSFKLLMDNVSRVYSYFHTIILKKDGSIWGCGSNKYGQLGYGSLKKGTPNIITNGVLKVSTRANFSLIVKTDGNLWGCGNNAHGQLGDGTTQSRSDFVKISSQVSEASAGENHTMFVKNDGSLWACGMNNYGQLGDNTYNDKSIPVKVMENVAHVSVGNNHSLILKRDGTLWGCGSNQSGQLGNSQKSNSSVPIKIMDDVANVQAGAYHTMIIKRDGSLWVCGSNGNGQLGVGTKLDQLTTPVKIMDDVVQCSGDYHSLIVKKDGTLWACGCNGDGQLGDGTYFNDRSELVKVMDNVVMAAAGGSHSIVLKEDGSVWSFGSNSEGQLGFESQNTIITNPQKILDNIIYVSAGNEHSFMISSSNQLLACGNDIYGQLGNGKSCVIPTFITNNIVFMKANIDGITYSLDDEKKEGIISQIYSQDNQVSVPAQVTYRNYSFPITTIGDTIFNSILPNDILGSVAFPSTIKEVSNKAFDHYGTHSIIWNSETPLGSRLFENTKFQESNFLLYVNKAEVAPANVSNVVINGHASNITLKDGCDFYCPQEFSVDNIQFTHNFTMETGYNDCAGWESIALPFDVKNVTHEAAGELTPFGNSNSQGKKFWLYSLSSNGFVEASAIKANTPYIISMPNNSYYGKEYNIPGRVTFSATNSIVKSTNASDLNTTKYGGATFRPNYLRLEKNETSYSLNVTNDYTTFYGSEKPGSVFIRDSRSINPFEAYFIGSATNVPKLYISFGKGSETTAINPLLRTNENQVEAYTLNGQKLQGKPTAKGIYIVNGRKVVIK